MKLNHFIIGAVVIFGALTLGWVASAQDDTPLEPAPVAEGEPFLTDGFQDGPGFPGWRHEMLEKELGLTQEQSDKLEKLRYEHMKASIDLQADLKKAGLEIAELMKTRGNDAAVLAKVKDISALRAKMAEQMVQHQLARRAVFTDEQWSKISDLRGAMMMRHKLHYRMQGREGREGRGMMMDRRGSGRGMMRQSW